VATRVFKKLLLSKKQVDQFFTAFDDLDSDGSGSVKMDEFFSFFRLESTEFNIELFRIFDSDGNGELTFLEFVCVVSNIVECEIFNM
jgi:Ca2+-binding EF-hand superfamily protein